ncbi:hypothetical protein [Halobacillus litoralis]|uniref:hypothetical protein n=1 Tax=Halobacillus litoralis TaxID=45668 RepID=UPI0013722BB9|nr:hypothetical protein [Halobacillus litoralis]MYL39821.1 hypothetical protein [Halobacillus litoralis]
MAKVSTKERKEKKDIAKQIMEAYGESYNEWLHDKHAEYIDENLMDYMKMQGDKKSQEYPSNEDGPLIASETEK